MQCAVQLSFIFFCRICFNESHMFCNTIFLRTQILCCGKGKVIETAFRVQACRINLFALLI